MRYRDGGLSGYVVWESRVFAEVSKTRTISWSQWDGVCRWNVIRMLPCGVPDLHFIERRFEFRFVVKNLTIPQDC